MFLISFVKAEQIQLSSLKLSYDEKMVINQPSDIYVYTFNTTNNLVDIDDISINFSDQSSSI